MPRKTKSPPRPRAASLDAALDDNFNVTLQTRTHALLVEMAESKAASDGLTLCAVTRRLLRGWLQGTVKLPEGGSRWK